MQQNPLLKYKPLWLVIGYALLAVIVYLSLTSDPIEIDLGIDYLDKLMHTLAYFTLMFWFAQIYHVRTQLVMFAVAFICVGMLMEFIQSFDPARYAEFEDMIANTLGVVIAVLLARSELKNLLLKFERSFL